MNELKKSEIALSALLLVWFLFTSTNVNVQLGTIYSIFTISMLVYVLVDPHRDLSLKNNSDSVVNGIVLGAAAWAVLALLGTYVILPGVQSMLKLLAASTPALSSSVMINKINFGIAIAITETLFFFVYGFDLLASMINVKIERRNLKTVGLWLAIIAISTVFMLFHLSAKGITTSSIPTLVLVWFMATISLVLVTWTKSANAAIWFHVISNSLAIGLIPGFGY